MLPDGFITECRREFDRDPGSTDTLIRLLEKAFTAGRESAYTTDEWRVNNGGLMWGQSEIRSEAEKLLAASRDGWLEHRRKGATDWKRCDA